jgi:hypothetical protein
VRKETRYYWSNIFLHLNRQLELRFFTCQLPNEIRLDIYLNRLLLFPSEPIYPRRSGEKFAEASHPLRNKNVSERRVL